MALYPPIPHQDTWERLNLCASTLRVQGVLTKKERDMVHKRILKLLEKEAAQRVPNGNTPPNFNQPKDK